MSRKIVVADDPVDELEVTPPKTYAAGLSAVRKAIEYRCRRRRRVAPR